MKSKVTRMLDIYTRLLRGDTVTKAELAKKYGVDERSIQRDIADLRSYLSDIFDYSAELSYEPARGVYRIKGGSGGTLTNSETLAVCKILLESRAMVKSEMYPIIDKLLSNCVPTTEYKRVSELVSNEKYHYLEPHHGKEFVDVLWNIGSAVYEHRLMRIRYQKLKEPDKVMRLIQPVGIMFSEYYFYLTAYICADENNPDIPKRPFPTIYRIDRIAEYETLEEHFRVPYADRFEEGEFRKRIQFMFGGELRRIKFLYRGISLEAVLDRFPTATVVSQDEQGYVITAEVYGDGVNMWLRSQGDAIKILE
ncbi:MAG: transcriptional regulator [Ruminococcus sp.]|nr:transcriptional regulator [Ruminococcus sp.]